MGKMTIHHDDEGKGYCINPNPIIEATDDDYVIEAGVLGEYRISNSFNITGAVEDNDISIGFNWQLPQAGSVFKQYVFKTDPEGEYEIAIPSAGSEMVHIFWEKINASPVWHDHFNMTLSGIGPNAFIKLIPWKKTGYFMDAQAPGITVLEFIAPLKREVISGHQVRCSIYSASYILPNFIKKKKLGGTYLTANKSGKISLDLSHFITEPSYESISSLDSLYKKNANAHQYLQVHMNSVEGRENTEGEVTVSKPIQFLNFDIAEFDFKLHFGSSIKQWLIDTNMPFLSNRSNERRVTRTQNEYLHWITQENIVNLKVKYKLTSNFVDEQSGEVTIPVTTFNQGQYEIYRLNVGFKSMGFDLLPNSDDIRFYEVWVKNTDEDPTGKVKMTLMNEKPETTYWYYVNNFNCIETITSNGLKTNTFSQNNTGLVRQVASQGIKSHVQMVISGENNDVINVSFDIQDEAEKRAAKDLVNRGWIFTQIGEGDDKYVVQFIIQDGEFQIDKSREHMTVLSLDLRMVSKKNSGEFKWGI